MTTRYVGPGGNDGNSGLTWALRKLTLNGVEDTPVVAGDTIYVGPGVYRELLTVDVSGAGGQIITYIADVTGANTDSIGGIVRITGSNNDQTAARTRAIQASVRRNYRTFRGFFMDMTINHAVDVIDGNDWIIEDCSFEAITQTCVLFQGANQSDHIVRRCWFLWPITQGIQIQHGIDLDAPNHLIENCLFLGCRGESIYIGNVGNSTIKNCTFISTGDDHIDVALSPSVGQTWTVNNCIFVGADSNALEATTLGDITEDYNTFWANSADRFNVNVGANSVTYPPLFMPGILFDGIKYPRSFGELSEWSQIRRITGTGEATDDLFGMTRPVTSAKKSWGAVQFKDMERETGTKRTGVSSLVLHDAGRHQIWVPVTATSTTIEVYVYREANYAGNLPQMIIKQPGQADDVTTDVGAAGGWNQLTTTLVPAADPPYVVVELVSRNTAAAGNYDTFFDDLDVS